MELAVIVRADRTSCAVKYLETEEPASIAMSSSMLERQLAPSNGDLVLVDGVSDQPQVVYLWHKATVIERSPNALTVRFSSSLEVEVATAWAVHDLGAVDTGDSVFLDTRRRRWVAVDRAAGQVPEHPERFLEHHETVLHEVQALCFWRRPAGPLHDDLVSIDDDLVQRLLRRQFPQWAELPLRRIASSGTVHAIYRLGPDLAIRLPMSPRFAGLEQEFELISLLGPKLPLTVPQPVALGQADEGYEMTWGIIRWLPGQPWRPGLVDEVPAAHQLADFLETLQALETTPAPPSSFAAIGHGQAKSDLAVSSALLASYGLAPVEAIGAAWTDGLALPEWNGPPVWLHGDLLAGNVLVADGKLAAVIDWGTSGVGDPARDLMAGWTLFGPEARAAFRSRFSYDEATWRRARTWVFTRITNVPYYWETNPEFAGDALRTMQAALEDDPSGWTA
jgi:aminoglycoside phosphotransferase (APT) family kinase protein